MSRLVTMFFLLAFCAFYCYSQSREFFSSLIKSEDENLFESKELGNENPKQPKGENRGGFVISAYVGATETTNFPLTISQPGLGNNLTFEDVRFDSRSFKSPLYYGFRGGYFIPQMPFLGFEAEFTHLKVYTNPQQQVRVRGDRRGAAIDRRMPLGDIVQQYSISHGANFLLFNIAA